MRPGSGSMDPRLNRCPLMSRRPGLRTDGGANDTGRRPAATASETGRATMTAVLARVQASWVSSRYGTHLGCGPSEGWVDPVRGSGEVVQREPRWLQDAAVRLTAGRARSNWGASSTSWVRPRSTGSSRDGRGPGKGMSGRHSRSCEDNRVVGGGADEWAAVDGVVAEADAGGTHDPVDADVGRRTAWTA